LTLALAAVAAALAWRLRAVAPAVAIALVLTGFVSARLRTAWVETPMVRAYTPDVRVAGRVFDVDRLSAKRLMLVLDVEDGRRTAARGEAAPPAPAGDRHDGGAAHW
jgi:hypothetical protein